MYWVSLTLKEQLGKQTRKNQVSVKMIQNNTIKKFVLKTKKQTYHGTIIEAYNIKYFYKN